MFLGSCRLRSYYEITFEDILWPQLSQSGFSVQWKPFCLVDVKAQFHFRVEFVYVLSAGTRRPAEALTQILQQDRHVVVGREPEKLKL